MTAVCGATQRHRRSALEVEREAMLCQHLHRRKARVMEGWKGCELCHDVLRERALAGVVDVSTVFQQLPCSLKVPCNQHRSATSCQEH